MLATTANLLTNMIKGAQHDPYGSKNMGMLKGD